MSYQNPLGYDIHELLSSDRINSPFAHLAFSPFVVRMRISILEADIAAATQLLLLTNIAPSIIYSTKSDARDRGGGYKKG